MDIFIQERLQKYIMYNCSKKECLQLISRQTKVNKYQSTESNPYFYLKFPKIPQRALDK